MPTQVRARSADIKASAHRDMDRLRISQLAVSSHPYDLGADPESPIMTYRDPISQWLVTQLISVREGRAGQAIPVEYLTLARAVETAWLYLYVTVMIPASVAARSMPAIATIAGPLTVGTLIALPIMLGVYGARQIYQTVSKRLIDACIVSVTRSQKERAGKSVKDLRFAYPVPEVVKDMAGQVMLADSRSCKPIGDLPLTRIVTRTSDYLQSISPGVQGQRIRAATANLDRFMRSTTVPDNPIPADPADFNTIEKALSLGLSPVPFVGGAPIDIILGLNHNRNKKLDFAHRVPLSSLSVTKSLTAAYYAYGLATSMVEIAWRQGGMDPAAALVNQLFPGLGITSAMLPKTTGIVGAPNLYGLVVFHNVVRSLCLAEDATTTGPSTRGDRPVSAARW
ncbi:hypothetical protein [Gordonia rhizosphera]|uniref:Uncharacterized protein n=2 Tax=Gordonia rhizosphera TaxID=83341 RepID=K6W3A8_9ACTN|nr:hypothetical protein GORHZ_009_00160 [Gordonia rhizosphera NBRC 16068]